MAVKKSELYSSLWTSCDGHRITGRVTERAERYEQTLPELENEVTCMVNNEIRYTLCSELC